MEIKPYWVCYASIILFCMIACCGCVVYAQPRNLSDDQNLFCFPQLLFNLDCINPKTDCFSNLLIMSRYFFLNRVRRSRKVSIWEVSNEIRRHRQECELILKLKKISQFTQDVLKNVGNIIWLKLQENLRIRESKKELLKCPTNDSKYLGTSFGD